MNCTVTFSAFYNFYNSPEYHFTIMDLGVIRRLRMGPYLCMFNMIPYSSPILIFRIMGSPQHAIVLLGPLIQLSVSYFICSYTLLYLSTMVNTRFIIRNVHLLYITPFNFFLLPSIFHRCNSCIVRL